MKCRLAVAALIWGIMGCCAFYFVATGAFLPEFEYRGIKLVSLCVVLTLIVLPLGAFSLAIKSLRHLVNTAKILRNELCVSCEFPLGAELGSAIATRLDGSRRPELSKCPECGTAIDPQSGERWQRALQRLGVEPPGHVDQLER